MKLGSLRRDPITGKAGYVVRFIGKTAICRDADGQHFQLVPGQVKGKAVRINIFGVPGEYGGVLLSGERVVVTDGDAIWNGCELTKNTASWERVKS